MGKELPNARRDIYVLAFRNVPLEQLEEAVARGLENKWVYFPQIPEIREELRKVYSPDAHAKACDRLRRRLETQPPVKMFRSVLDEAPAGLLPIERARELGPWLTRGRKIALGIEEPAPVDIPSKYAELRRQAEVLFLQEQAEKAGLLHISADITEGLS